MPNLIRRIRSRFGISAPKMTVRTHLAWYWRWLGMVVAGAASLALAAWVYDAGRRFAGFDRSEVEQELSQLRATVAKLQEDSKGLRAIADASESRLKIEQSAQSQLALQVKSLEDQNTRLKEDLAFFENLTPAGDKVSIHRKKKKRDRAFQGSLQLLINVQDDRASGTIVLPERSSGGSSPPFKLAFKYFQRVEGTFRVPRGAKVLTVQVRVLESGSDQARATENFNLS